MLTLERRHERHGYTHARVSLSGQTGGGGQKAAAAPREPALTARPRGGSARSTAASKCAEAGPTHRAAAEPPPAPPLTVLHRSFNGHFARPARSDSCCLGATSLTRWRTRPCHRAPRPAQRLCSAPRTEPLGAPLTRSIWRPAPSAAHGCGRTGSTGPLPLPWPVKLRRVVGSARLFRVLRSAPSPPAQTSLQGPGLSWCACAADSLLPVVKCPVVAAMLGRSTVKGKVHFKINFIISSALHGGGGSPD